MGSKQLDVEISEEELIKQSQKGSAEAEEVLIRKYKEVVRRKAHLYFMVGADSEDVMQEGMIGLFKAIRSFSDQKNTSFRTFAELCINRQIMSAITKSQRMKNMPLNSSISLNTPVGANEDREDDMWDSLDERLASPSAWEPESFLIMKEKMEDMVKEGKGLFSELEIKVLNEYLLGRSNCEISLNTGKSYKAVDNALQRIRKKLQKYL